ncbi:MAG TPA: NUDIX hydrolase [Actinobacteria bacterium]|nr:NUDIX hydrolase [Actinomycetota bacterium]HDL49528.1 NUDIX hydrolase [Actinomycetota bacterium]
MGAGVRRLESQGAEEVDVIRAAGGIILSGRSVVLVHRPKYDDWTFPKGKLDGSEGFRDAALREVEEETGLTCRLGRWLSDVEYVDSGGRQKMVRYWLMEVVGGDVADHEPNAEIDAVEWAPVQEAAERLTYGFDRKLLALIG